jgi:hypothetical protein
MPQDLHQIAFGAPEGVTSISIMPATMGGTLAAAGSADTVTGTSAGPLDPSSPSRYSLRQLNSAHGGGTESPDCDSIRGVMTPLPIDLAAAHALILRQREELAAAAACASGAEAMIAHLKLMIAKLRREQYGQSAKRGRKILDQLELQLEELEADESETPADAKAAAGSTVVEGFTRRRPVRAPLPPHLPRERIVIPAPCACRTCGGKLAKPGEDVTATPEVIPRQWKGVHQSGRQSHGLHADPLARLRRLPR